MQSKTNRPFCTRIEHYKLAQYESLNGNYSNITKNMTKKLEPVPYESTAYAAYREVNNIMKSKNKPQITF